MLTVPPDGDIAAAVMKHEHCHACAGHVARVASTKKSGHQSVVAQDNSVGVLKLDGPRRTGLFADIMVS